MKTLGKILGAIGVLLFLSAPLTLLTASSSSFWLPGGKALLGVLLMCLYVATHYHQLMKSESPVALAPSSEPAPLTQGTRTSFFYLSTILITVMALVVLGGANFIAARRNKTWDLTNKKIDSDWRKKVVEERLLAVLGAAGDGNGR